MNQFDPQQAFQAAIGLQRQGRPADACVIYQQLLEQFPNDAELLFSCGIAAMQAGQAQLAQALFSRTVTLRPEFAGAHYNLGNSLCEQECFDQAIACYSRAIALAPQISGIYTMRGNALCRMGRQKEALADYSAALIRNPQSAEAHYNYANALDIMGKNDEALTEYDQAISLKPDFCSALTNRGTLLLTKNKPEAALADFDAALALLPEDPDLWNNTGSARMQRKQYPEALFCFDKALALRNCFPAALRNRSQALYKLSRFTEALKASDRAIALHPDYAKAYIDRAVILSALGRFADAIASDNQALNLQPDNIVAIFDKAFLLLLTGHIQEGLELYEMRWQRDSFQKQIRHFAQPKWCGEEIRGKRLFIWHEQGLGDFIQCARFAVMAAARGAKVLLETPAQMMDLARSLPRNIALLPFRQEPPGFDLHIPAMSLLHTFKATEEMLGETVPYLAADPTRMKKWQTHLGQKTRPRIGITWAGNPGHQNDVRRSIAAERLKPLFDLPFDFHLLQVDLRDNDADFVTRQPNLHLHLETIEDYADTAALMQEMDQIISVDTSVVHLAGALGLPVWVMLPWVPDWRWMLEREDSPWYPTARLFRQQSAGDWDGVIERIRAALLQSG